ncbi:ABC.CD.A [Mytilus coruscus]|uniref:ABC.CD.A n=1 Tax=Mytilus coruscus TaxID=42192 RepID=A0A6J8AQ92_MYTCO|nr:ABC.CD.A [Mytilus coruscus]
MTANKLNSYPNSISSDYEALVRLGGENYKEICAQLRVASLSSGKRYGMKNIHQEIIEDWIEIEIKMVETNAIKELIKVIKKSNFIAVIGPSGCGKSIAAHQVALFINRNEGYQIVPSNFPTDITHYYNKSEKQVFVFDDVCGKYSLDYDLLKQWKKLSTELDKIKQCENVIILVSSRSDIFYQIKDVQFLFTTQFDMLSKDYSLCDNERFLIAEAHIGAKNAEFLRKAELLNRYDFFPLLCQIFASEKKRNIENFFTQPVKVIKKELTLMKEEQDQTSFAVLALFVIYDNCITDEILSSTSGIKTILSNIAEECELSTILNIKVVRKNLERFLHSYVKKIGSSYMIMHDKLFDIFVSFYGEHLPDIILTHCSYRVIFTRFQLQPVEHKDDCMINIPAGYEAKYFQRLFHDSKVDDFDNIFWNDQLKHQNFRQQFLKFLSEDQNFRDLCRSSSNTGSSPLITTAAKGYNDILRVLLDMKLNVNVCDELELTPMAYAAAGGHLKQLKYC